MSAFARIDLPAFALDRSASPIDRCDEPGSSALIAWTPGQAARSRLKRSVDKLAALTGLIVLAPLMALIALLIWLESRGPILFRQPRAGLGGVEFTCLKFRSMVSDAEAQLEALESRNEVAGGVLFKIRSDPRITRLGRFLRRSSLDELPQLWNVVRGEMSLVGPRPLQRRDSERLARLDPVRNRHRLSVRPGITGAWQVGGRSDVDSQRMLDLDIAYVNDWSLRLDTAILLKTIGVVLAGRGAS